MNSLQRDAVLLELVEQLRRSGSWCGETHIQKAAYFLQELLGVPTRFPFVLYWYGPFSFELRDELGQLKTEGLLRLLPQEPYGPRFVPTELSGEFRGEFPKTLGRYGDRIAYISGRLGDKGVTELGKLATALYVTSENPDLPPAQRALLLRRIKPRLTREGAIEAINDVDSAIEEVKETFGPH
jgi:hypothetical protein